MLGNEFVPLIISNALHNYVKSPLLISIYAKFWLMWQPMRINYDNSSIRILPVNVSNSASFEFPLISKMFSDTFLERFNDCKPDSD